MIQLIRATLVVQGILYVVTGVWPLLDTASFEAVTGPKVDDWLVYTVGLLLVVVGCVLLSAVVRRRIDLSIMVLAFGVALALASIEVAFGLDGRIWRIYLLDAAIELVFAAIMTIGILRGAPARAALER
jgi:hypothetical protein